MKLSAIISNITNSKSEQPLMVVTVGVSGCGKSTFAKDLLNSTRNSSRQFVELNPNSTRRALYSFDKWEDYSFKANEGFVKTIFDYMLRQAIQHQKSIVISNTNLSRKNIVKYRELADLHGYDFLVVCFTTAPSVCVLRNRQRQQMVLQDETIGEQYNRWKNVYHWLTNEEDMNIFFTPNPTKED